MVNLKQSTKSEGIFMKRLLNCHASDFEKMSKEELKQAILASEGRTVLSENVVISQPLLGDLTNAETAAAFGADLILLNVLDVFNPVIQGFEQGLKDPIQTLKKLVGRPVGVNLEPVDVTAEAVEDLLQLPVGRRATKETLIKANELGFDFICLTGNPSTGVSNQEIEEAILLAKEHFDGLIIAGKMHGAGVAEPVVDQQSIENFIANGADIILMPAVGTVPGLLESEVHEAVKLIKSKGALSMTAIGTSQESSDPQTIREFALSSKRAGVDIQHIGDAGYSGVADPENLMALSIAIRGKRHTYYRMAQSIRR